MSMKKSILLVVAVIVLVTAFQLVSSGGNVMLIDMGDTSISFSGIDDFRHEVAYRDIVSVTLEEVPNWDRWGGHEFGEFRVGHINGASAEDFNESYVLFVTTKADNVIIATLADGSWMVFNYNNTSDTEAIYGMLLENVSAVR